MRVDALLFIVSELLVMVEVVETRQITKSIDLVVVFVTKNILVELLLFYSTIYIKNYFILDILFYYTSILLKQQAGILYYSGQ